METDRADALTCVLSIQSVIHPDRHVWIDTDLRAPGIPPGGIGSVLEDWFISGEWDNAVARVRCISINDALAVNGTWLAGGNLDGYSNVGKDYATVSRLST